MTIDIRYQDWSRSDSPSHAGNGASWYANLSRAWGHALDVQAERVVKLSNGLSQGDPDIGQVLIVSTEAQLMGVLSSSAATVNNSIGEALQTLGRK